jgi:hypothetical protein
VVAGLVAGAVTTHIIRHGRRQNWGRADREGGRLPPSLEA